MIICFGSLNADMTFQMDKAPKSGQTLLANSFTMSAGGKGANQAVAAARLGGEVAMVGAVGSDALAQVALEHLKASNCDVSRVAVVDHPTGCASVIVDSSAHNQIAVAMGANELARATSVDDALLQRANILLLQMESGKAEVETLLKRAKEAGVKSILNLAPAVKIDLEALKACGILVVNEDEAEFVAQWLACDPSAQSISKTLGICVIRTLGSDGAEAADGEDVFKVSAVRVDAKDTTSAGDCFVGALASFLDQNFSLKDAMEKASLAAAICCSRHGSQISLPWADELVKAA
ncbi:ribokinase [Cohaesibacter sp. ES.047]|uniref:ribokinase n=1 Tax=Cohaesibacter sp. ES.047 TaxID=1798205 RepID=UPI000BB87E6C|nr:ribokinase [Cohaesibacter sp. ES.047]SNY92711.1 ribokinase [Cohaesibacter sp. ES.047]